ncbi:MAG TPA: class I SAM-dependent methyltransferase [Burkholderiaceae bacterium]|nr:class I SAM-dependent methyltransferase [Burkholderiaceae bacterium]
MATPENPQVRLQYERFPYPERKAEDERTRLISTWLDDLRMINHHCFGGARSFDDGFRALVAGGGTGDGTVFLAEQLRGLNAEVVHLDISRTALDIARERVRLRGLTNVRFVEASLLELPGLGLGTFDYINCAGVLHHLPDPPQGLDALLAVLARDGALGLLLYAQYGRTGVYQMQSLLRILCADTIVDARKIDLARATLAALPASNWFIRGEDLHQDHRAGGDAGLYDLLLHPQDRAYTVPEIYEWFTDRRGLAVTWSDWHRGRLPYLPETHLTRTTPELLARLAALSERERCAVAELSSGAIITHSFYATRAAGVAARYGEVATVPMLANDAATGPDVAAVIDAHGRKPFVLQHARSGLSRLLDPGRHVREIFMALDGRRSFGEIFDEVRRAARPAPDDAALFAEFEPWFRALESIDRLLLRRPGAYAGLTGYQIA